MERRPLRLPNYPAVVTEAENLLASGYRRAGNWNLGQVCHHLATVLAMSLDGFPSRMPWPFRQVARWLILGRLLRHQVIRMRFPAPAYLNPPPTTDDTLALEKLRAVIDRLERHTGPMQPHPVFGPLTPEQWREVNLWHCEHHFSFLHPASTSTGLAGAPPLA